MHARRIRPLLLLATAAALLTGCGAGKTDGSFDAQPGTPSPTCLQHGHVAAPPPK